ncbi:hypothetical protein [Spirosoma arcticum]
MKKLIINLIALAMTATIANAQTPAAGRCRVLQQQKNTFINPTGLFNPEKKKILIEVAGKEWGAKVFPASSIVPLPMLATAPGCLIEVETIATN